MSAHSLRNGGKIASSEEVRYMAMHPASIHLKRQRGKLTVFIKGKTPRGQSVMGLEIALEARSTSDPRFKAQLAAAVRTLMPDSPPVE